MRLHTSLHGEVEFRKRLQRLKDNTPQVVADAAYEEMKIEADEVRDRTPVDTGALRGTVKAVEPIIKNKYVESGVTAGGPQAMHALIVHEDLEAEHAVGEAKYIERTLNESAPFIMKRVGNRISFDRALS